MKLKHLLILVCLLISDVLCAQGTSENDSLVNIYIRKDSSVCLVEGNLVSILGLEKMQDLNEEKLKNLNDNSIIMLSKDNSGRYKIDKKYRNYYFTLVREKPLSNVASINITNNTESFGSAKFSLYDAKNTNKESILKKFTPSKSNFTIIWGKDTLNFFIEKPTHSLEILPDYINLNGKKITVSNEETDYNYFIVSEKQFTNDSISIVGIYIKNLFEDINQESIEILINDTPKFTLNCQNQLDTLNVKLSKTDILTIKNTYGQEVKIGSQSAFDKVNENGCGIYIALLLLFAIILILILTRKKIKSFFKRSKPRAKIEKTETLINYSAILKDLGADDMSKEDINDIESFEEKIKNIIDKEKVQPLKNILSLCNPDKSEETDFDTIISIINSRIDRLLGKETQLEDAQNIFSLQKNVPISTSFKKYTEKQKIEIFNSLNTQLSLNIEKPELGTIISKLQDIIKNIKPNRGDSYSIERPLWQILQKPTSDQKSDIERFIKDYLIKHIAGISNVKNLKEILSVLCVKNNAPEVNNTDVKHEKNENIEVHEFVSGFGNLDESEYDNDAVKNLVIEAKKADDVENLSRIVAMRLKDINTEICSLKNKNKDSDRTLKKCFDYVIKENKTILNHNLVCTNNSLYNVIKDFVKEIKSSMIDKDRNITNKKKEIVEIKDELSDKKKNIASLLKLYASYIHATFDDISSNVMNSCDERNSNYVIERIKNRIINNDARGLNDFCKDLNSVLDENAGENLSANIKNEFLKCLETSSWIDILTEMYLLARTPEVSKQFYSKGIDCSCVITAFALTEQIMKNVGIKLHYPRLFSDSFDADKFEEKSMSDIEKIADGLSDLVGTKQNLIVDLSRVGFSIDGELKQKPTVYKFN